MVFVPMLSMGLFVHRAGPVLLAHYVFISLLGMKSLPYSGFV